MKYSIDYIYCRVLIESSQEVYQFVKQTIGCIFKITSNIESANNDWKIQLTEQRIYHADELDKAKEIQLEHNLYGIVMDLNQNESYIQDKNHCWELVINREEHKIILFGETCDVQCMMIRKLLRQVTKAEIINKNYKMLHASCFTVDNNGILVIGDKGSGKTTTLMKMLDEYDDLYYLTNDVAVVKGKNIYTVFDDIKVGIGTLSNLKKFYYDPDDFNYTTKKRSYPLKKYIDMCSIHIKSSAILQMIFFVELSNNDSGVTISEIDYELFKAKICKNILNKGKQTEIVEHPDWLNITEDRNIALEEACKEIYKYCKSFNLKIGIKNELNLDALYKLIVNML
jgi:hypothetical protein